jgi:hypothetical protein
MAWAIPPAVQSLLHTRLSKTTFADLRGQYHLR